MPYLLCLAVLLLVGSCQADPSSEQDALLQQIKQMEAENMLLDETIEDLETTTDDLERLVEEL